MAVLPDGQLVREERVDGLDFPVFAEYATKNSRHSIKVENTDRREPDPLLFQIPADYTRMDEQALSNAANCTFEL